MAQQFYYGGQAVIEGVLIRGRESVSLAVRCPNGSIWSGSLSLGTLYKGPLRRIPLVRGVIVLVETLLVGIRALNRSAEISMAPPDATEIPEPGKADRVALVGSLGLALLVGVGVLFLLPLFGARSLDFLIPSALASNVLEGLIRLTLLVGYIWAIGHMQDIKRVFAYHGAEHMTIHAYEHGVALEAEQIARFPTAHPRCGTAFLLTVVVVSILVFALLGRPSLEIAVLSRLALVPVIASISYELLRLGAAHNRNVLARLMVLPGLALQRLTTRIPDEEQIEVAVTAMKNALAADAEATASSP